MTGQQRNPAYGPVTMVAVIKTAVAFGAIANATAPDSSQTVAGSLPGDTIEVTPLGTWDAGLLMGPHRCAVAGTVLTRIGNVTGAPITPAAQDVKYTLNHIQP